MSEQCTTLVCDACLQLKLGSIHSHDTLTPSHLQLKEVTLSHCVGHNRTSLTPFSFESAAEFLEIVGVKANQPLLVGNFLIFNP